MITLDRKRHWLALLSVNGIGRKTVADIDRYLNKEDLTWSDFKKMDEQQLRNLGLAQDKMTLILDGYKRMDIKANYQKIISQGVEIISYLDVFPDLLREIDDKPLLLFVKSKYRDNLKKVRQIFSAKNYLPIAFVGTRKMTQYGRDVIEKLMHDLRFYNVVINSGFMYGVDEYSHRMALNSGLPSVGILGYGFNYVYPKRFQKKMKHYYHEGMIFLSEYPPQTKPCPAFFPQRNRIIAGMSWATVVIEAAKKSGSLITAQLAVDYGREVFAVPGNISSPFSEGTKALVNEGAVLISSGQEIIQSYNEFLPADKKIQLKKSQKKFDLLTKQCQSLEKEQQILLKELSVQPLTIRELSQITSMPPDTIMLNLAELDLLKYVTQQGEKWYAKMIAYN